MALLTILKFPHPILRAKAKPVTDFGPELAGLVADMADTMYDAPGVGLAANQIGVARQILIYDPEPDKEKRAYQVVINPKITIAEGEEMGEEGCLSVREYCTEVKRAWKIVVEAQLADGLPVVELDPDRFRQMLINVLGNAADAMTTGGTLRVTTRQAAGGSTVVLDVCDDGIGIDPSIRDRVFDPFVSTKRDGVGLGLVNARAVIESHGGTIELFPTEPKGTCARMTMPATTRHG